MSFPRIGCACVLAALVLIPAAAADTKGQPVATVFEIQLQEPQDGVQWIRTRTEFVVRLDLPLQAVADLLRDYPGYMKYNDRIRAVDVLSRGATDRVRQRYEVSLLGYKYPSQYDLDIGYDESGGAKRWVQYWTFAGSDGTIGDSRGSWTLEAAGTPEAPETVATVRNTGLVRKDFPLQVQVMRMAAKGALARSINRMYQEGKKRLAAAGGTLAAYPPRN